MVEKIKEEELENNSYKGFPIYPCILVDASNSSPSIFDKNINHSHIEIAAFIKFNNQNKNFMTFVRYRDELWENNLHIDLVEGSIENFKKRVKQIQDFGQPNYNSTKIKFYEITQ